MAAGEEAQQNPTPRLCEALDCWVWDKIHKFLKIHKCLSHEGYVLM